MTKIVLKIRKVALLLAVFTAMFSHMLWTTPAHADGEYYLTWVSGTGSDSNSSTGCQQTAPCQTFATALAQTVTGGEVNCAGPVGYHNFGTVSITYSVTIDCHDMFGSIFPTVGYNAITINAPGSDVVLRNLNLDGWAQHGPNFAGDAAANGILIQAAARVEIDDCKIMNFGQRGIDDVRTTGSTQLLIRNSIIRGNTGTGIALAAAAHNSVVLDNVASVGNAYGVAAATGNSVVVTHSVMSENSTAGVYTDSGATISVDSSVISHNISYGVQANGTVLLANTEIMFNTSSISGATSSYGNNRIYGNGGGTTPTITAQQ